MEHIRKAERHIRSAETRIRAESYTILGEFRAFLKEYKVVALAIAFVMGTATTALVNSLVNNIIMPSVTPFISHGNWQSATLTLGPVVLGIGPFAAQVLNFLILAIVVFFFVKFVLREDKKSAGK